MNAKCLCQLVTRLQLTYKANNEEAVFCQPILRYPWYYRLGNTGNAISTIYIKQTLGVRKISANGQFYTQDNGNQNYWAHTFHPVGHSSYGIPR